MTHRVNGGHSRALSNEAEFFWGDSAVGREPFEVIELALEALWSV